MKVMLNLENKGVENLLKSVLLMGSDALRLEALRNPVHFHGSQSWKIVSDKLEKSLKYYTLLKKLFVVKTL